MMGYTKLFTEIIMSTVWREKDHVRLLWITMLALKDRWHVVNASLPGLADSARITMDECEDALEVLSQPDPHSRTKDFEGRRIEECDGGWIILNGEKYRNKMSLDERREYQRIKQKEYRARGKGVKRCQQSSQQFTHTEEEAKADTNKKDQESSQNSKRVLTVPFEEILKLYHENLPELPRCLKLTTTRKAHIRQRWLEDFPDLDSWKTFFGYVKKSRFLTGKSSNGRPFRATLDWLIKQENAVKVVEGKYE